MSYNKQLKKDLFKLVVSNPDFIHNLLKYEFKIPFSKDSNMNNLLQLFIINKDSKGINLLLDNIKNNIYGTDVNNYLLNNQNNEGNASIHLAILNNQQDIAKRLYKLGANLALSNKDDFVVELSESDVKEQNNEMETILSQITIPIDRASNSANRRINIPAILETISSSEMPDNIQVINPKKLNEFDFIKNFIDTNNNIISEKPQNNTIDTADFLRFIKSRNLQIGGNKDESSIDTNDFLKYISQEEIQSGGKKSKKIDESIKGTRQLQTNPEMSNTEDSLDIGELIRTQRGGKKNSKKRYKLADRIKTLSNKNNISTRRSSSRRRKLSSRHGSNDVNRPSSDMHQEVVDILKKNYSLSEDDARYIKAGFYHMIKEKFANLSNMQRALKLKEIVMDQEEVKKMIKQLPQLKEIVTKAREQKQKEILKNKSNNTVNKDMTTDDKKNKEPKKEKEPKKDKKEKEPKKDKKK